MVYSANVVNGALDPAAPVVVTWACYERVEASGTTSEEEGLLFIEKPVYGVDAKPGPGEGGGFLVSGGVLL